MCHLSKVFMLDESSGVSEQLIHCTHRCMLHLEPRSAGRYGFFLDFFRVVAIFPPCNADRGGEVTAICVMHLTKLKNVACRNSHISACT